MVTGVLFSVHDLVDHFLLLEYSLLVNRPGGEGGGVIVCGANNLSSCKHKINKW